MNIIFNRLYKIDITSEEVILLEKLQSNPNLKDYVETLLIKVSEQEPDRVFKFKSEHNLVASQINKMLLSKEYDASSLEIANRLLEKEIAAQKIVDKLKNIEVQRGILIISLVQMTKTDRKVIISKSDYNKFIEETTGDINTGLPIKKKIFKAFICDVDNDNKITKTTTFDTNSSVSSYWWKEFLELELVRTDKENTNKAFNAIEKAILEPIKREHKQDYIHLWNATIAYFKSEGEFQMSYYADEIIGNYQPYDDKLKIKKLKEKCKELSTKHDFDNRFSKDSTAINKRFKKVIELTPEIELIIKQVVPDMESTFKSYMADDGTKYLMIKSDNGYKYAEKVKLEPNE